MRYHARDIDHGYRLTATEVRTERLRLAHDMVQLVLKESNPPLPPAARAALMRVRAALCSMVEDTAQWPM
jgi:hypothetical protein